MKLNLTLLLLFLLAPQSKSAFGQRLDASGEGLPEFALRHKAIETLEEYSSLAGMRGANKAAQFQDFFSSSAKILVDILPSPRFGEIVSVEEYVDIKNFWHGTSGVTSTCRPVRFLPKLDASLFRLEFIKTCGGRTVELGQGEEKRKWSYREDNLNLIMTLRWDGKTMTIEGIEQEGKPLLFSYSWLQVTEGEKPIPSIEWEVTKGTIIRKSATAQLVKHKKDSVPQLDLTTGDTFWEHTLSSSPTDTTATGTPPSTKQTRESFSPTTFKAQRSKHHLRFVLTPFTRQNMESDVADNTPFQLNTTQISLTYGREFIDMKDWEASWFFGAFFNWSNASIAGANWSINQPSVDPAGTEYVRHTALDQWNEEVQVRAVGVALGARGTKRFSLKNNTYPKWGVSAEIGCALGLTSWGNSVSSAELSHSGTFPSLFNVTMDRAGLLDFGPQQGEGTSHWSGQSSASLTGSLSILHRCSKKGMQVVLGWSWLNAARGIAQDDTEIIQGTANLGSLVRNGSRVQSRGRGPFIGFQFPLTCKSK